MCLWMPAQLPASCNRMPSCAGALPPPSADDVLERATGASIEACCSKIARRLVHSRRELGSLLLHQHIDTPAAFHGPLQHCSNMPHIARDLIRLRPMPTCSVEGDHADRLREILGCLRFFSWFGVYKSAYLVPRQMRKLRLVPVQTGYVF